MDSKEIILIVDDDEGVRRSLAHILRKKGYFVESAASGKEALAIAQARPVSLTLLDIKLPDTGGILLLAPLKKTNPDMSVIMITGFASVESAVQSLTAGASGYITKPIDPDGMLVMIKNTLDHQHLVTGARRAEEELRESEERYRTIVENCNDALYIHDFKGNILDLNMNACIMLGYTKDELAGANLEKIDSEENRRVLPERMSHLLAEGSILFDGSHVRKDGTIIPVVVSAKVVSREGNGIIQEFVRDITRRKLAEDALRQANKKLNILSSITRHDINNQLLTLNGFLVFLHKKVPNPSLEEHFNRITMASNRISSMIRFTKEYESIGVHTPVWQEIRTLADTAAKEAPLGKVIVKNELPADQEVFADPLIIKVFYNLMDNAVRYGKKITTIRFLVQESGDDHIIVCEDDGGGVPAGEKKKIFEQGFGENTGMGLFLAREILDITGISIRETGEPGKGARFEIVVPKGVWRIAMAERKRD